MNLAPVFFIAMLAAAASDNGSAGIILDIDKAQEGREARLVSYTVTEHYTIRNSRFNDPAETVVETTYVKGEGKKYRIVSRSGPAFLQTHVMDRILREEEQMSKGEQRKSALVTSANYQIKALGQEGVEGRNCVVVELTPKMKSAHLLKGKAWLDAGSHKLIRIEGRPTASVAFLAGVPDVVREYTDLDGFSLARKSHAVSQSFFLGKTDLTIEYTDYRVNSASEK